MRPFFPKTLRLKVVRWFSAVVPAKLGGELPVVAKEEVMDFMPQLKSIGGYVQEKIEGFTVDSAGNAYAVTDNDGVADANGETLFLRLGRMAAK
jgi:hypothetical protein